MKIHSINARMPFYDGIDEVSRENDGKIRRFRMQHLLFTVQLHSWEVEKWEKKDPDDQEEAIRKALPKKVRESLKKENHSHDSRRIAAIQSETAAILKSNELLKQKLIAKASAKDLPQQPTGDQQSPENPQNQQPADNQQNQPADPDKQTPAKDPINELVEKYKELDKLDAEIKQATEDRDKATDKKAKDAAQCSINNLKKTRDKLANEIIAMRRPEA